MDSPPLSGGLSWSQGFPSSDDSGLLLMSGFSGSSLSSEESSAPMEVQESEEEAVRPENGMSCEDFDTLKKVPVVAEWQQPVAPPPEFQDAPRKRLVEKFAKGLVADVITDALAASSQITWAIECSHECHPSASLLRRGRRKDSAPRLCWTPEIPFSPCHHRPGSVGSLASSRLSISHNSLSIPRTKAADDSSFITLAMSHDLLLGDMSEIYNVPIDSDIYTLPVDTVHQDSADHRKHKRKVHRKKRRHTSSSSETGHSAATSRRSRRSGRNSATRASAETLEGSKRHSMPATSRRPGPSHSSNECSGRSKEPVHMTLQEVREYLQNLYSSSSDSMERRSEKPRARPSSEPKMPAAAPPPVVQRTTPTLRKATFINSIKMKKSKSIEGRDDKPSRKCSSFSNSIKQTLCSIFRFKKVQGGDPDKPKPQDKVIQEPPAPSGIVLESVNYGVGGGENARAPFSHRALPPLPPSTHNNNNDFPTLEVDEEEIQLLRIKEDDAQPPELAEESNVAFASSIQKVKDYGWYWGPISGEAAEKVLSTEPDGSFIVRDSSDQHYIFSLSFRLNGNVRHVRIEHDQGNFSFGSCTKFKSHTIVDFIENAVEHSRSGRYLFFLHRRPVLGPMRVQLLHPVSRFKQVSSLKHMCRFVILKMVRKDMIPELPLPRRVIEYLSTPHYYVEQQLEEENSGSSGSDLLSFVPHRPLS
ncbi:uncharacterized protein LOC132197874 [Neocloeon triangulifer]|uniref:uncharacterized protein LOC132197874 n=1 Tax=Neocloeon triangulifer TaxID=2078957 RepID=UPI00286F149E|nr:uncharacterized protein LOC132197874 [Neocloeon triangulifer]